MRKVNKHGIQQLSEGMDLAAALGVAGVTTPPAVTATETVATEIVVETAPAPQTDKQPIRVFLTLDEAAKAVWGDRNSEFHRKLGYVAFTALLISAAKLVDAGEITGTPVTEGENAGKVAVTADVALLNKLGDMISAHRAEIAAQRGENGDTAPANDRPRRDNRPIGPTNGAVGKPNDALDANFVGIVVAKARRMLDTLRDFASKHEDTTAVMPTGLVLEAEEAHNKALTVFVPAQQQPFLVEAKQKAEEAIRKMDSSAFDRRVERLELALNGVGVPANFITSAQTAIDAAREQYTTDKNGAFAVLVVIEDNLRAYRTRQERSIRQEREDTPRDSRQPRRDDRNRSDRRPAQFR